MGQQTATPSLGNDSICESSDPSHEVTTPRLGVAWCSVEARGHLGHPRYSSMSDLPLTQHSHVFDFFFLPWVWNTPLTLSFHTSVHPAVSSSWSRFLLPRYRSTALPRFQWSCSVTVFTLYFIFIGSLKPKVRVSSKRLIVMRNLDSNFLCFLLCLGFQLTPANKPTASNLQQCAMYVHTYIVHSYRHSAVLSRISFPNPMFPIPMLLLPVIVPHQPEHTLPKICI